MKREPRDGFAPIAFIGFLAGALNGLIGIGGGIVIVPGLMLHRRASPQVAVGTSLACVVVLSTVAFGVHAFFSGLVFGVTGLLVIIASGMLGTQVGGLVLARLTASRLLALFSLLLLVMSGRLVWQALGLTLEDSVWSGEPAAWAYPVIGFASGILSGLLGVGGGALVLLGFAALFAMPVHEGLPIALAVNVTNALAGCARHARAGRVLWREVRQMVPAAIAGVVAGSAVALALPPDWLRLLFAGFFLFMAVRIGYRSIRT